ncbi:MAG: OmpH family outer membrane protein [Bergeyella sp.]
MNNFKIILVLMILTSGLFSAQKIGVVDTNYILQKLPQYKEAEARLNSQITSWQTEIQTMQADYDKKKAALENEKVLLVGDQLKLREKEVEELDKKIKNIINSRFGTKGEINNARANLAKPFQDQIWNAIKTVSEKNSLGIVLDKTDYNVLFLEKRYDYTEKVLNLLVKNKPDSDSGKTKSSSNKSKGASGNTKASSVKTNRVNANSAKSNN